MSRELLQQALDLIAYAAAPFCSNGIRQKIGENEYQTIQPTTQEWWEGLRELIEAIQPALKAELAKPPSKEGLVMVPVEPTKAMLEAFDNAVGDPDAKAKYYVPNFAECYAAMIEAAKDQE